MGTKIKSIGRWLKEHWLWFVIIAFVAGGAGWWWWSKNQTAQKKVVYQHPKIETIEQTIDAPGVTRAKQVARLRFLAGGKVVYIGAKAGDLVKRGQTIATIDRAALQKQLDQNLNQYERQRYDWEQAADNVKNTASTNKIERDTKKNQLTLDDTVLNVEIQNIAIQNTVLSAPFAGILTASPTNVSGVQLTTADYFEVVNPDSVYFVARVDEADVARIHEGQAAIIKLDAYPDAPIDSHVQRVAFQSVETGSGTQFEVEFPVASQSAGVLRLGMNGDVSIKLGKSENALTIPLIATRSRSGKIYVDVKDGDKTVEREIKTGIETDERVEVTSGLTETDEIVVPQ